MGRDLPVDLGVHVVQTSGIIVETVHIVGVVTTGDQETDVSPVNVLDRITAPYPEFIP
jgi:hypothetical protein